MAAGGAWQLLGPAGKDIILQITLFNEGGQPVTESLPGWGVSCSWAPGDAEPGGNGIVHLPAVRTEQQQQDPSEKQVQLLHQGQLVDSLAISFRTLPDGVHATAGLRVLSEVEAGEDCNLSLHLKDKNGQEMSAEDLEDLFCLDYACVSWDGSQERFVCSLEEPMGIIVSVPSDLILGMHSLHLQAELEPIEQGDRPLLGLLNDGAIKVSAELQLEIRAGPATALALEAPEECMELDLLEISATASDATGVATANVPEKLALTVHLGELSMPLQQDPNDTSTYSCQLHADVIPGQYTLSLTATGADKLELPPDKAISVRPCSRVAEVRLQHRSDAQWGSTCLELSPEKVFSVRAELVLADDAPERTISREAMLDGLSFALSKADGDSLPAQPELELITTGAGLCFDYSTAAIQKAGKYVLQATWQEQEPNLKADLERAIHADKDCSAWQPPSSNALPITIKPDAADRLRAFWCNRITGNRTTLRSAEPGSTLPAIGIKILDKHENSIDPELSTCLITSKMDISIEDMAQGHMAPTLAHEGAATFQANWHPEAQAFIMPEEASQLSSEAAGSSGEFKVTYRVEVEDDLSLSGLDSSVSFKFKLAAEVRSAPSSCTQPSWICYQ